VGAALIVLLVAFAAALPVAPAQAPPKVTVVSFGLYGGQDVFRSEATGAAQIVASRFGGDPVVVRFNSRKNADATIETLAATLDKTAKGMDRSSDILFLILTSHGSPEGLAVSAGRRGDSVDGTKSAFRPMPVRTLTPSRLGAMLERTGVRHKVVIISACYSGVFIPRLANANTLVITAADRHHPSFGCEDKATWTYFGDAFFNSALRQAQTLKEAFTQARSLVLTWELRSGFEPSNPQIAGGENVEPLLVAR
jgi:hypothetical protein